MIKVGGKEVVFKATLLIPEDEKAEIEITDVIQTKIIISFENNGGAESIKPVPWKDGTGVELIFKNWNQSLGTSLNTHVTFAQLKSGSKLQIIATNYKIGKVNNLDIQLVIEEVEK